MLLSVLFLDTPSIGVLDYWASVLQNSIGCALGSIAGICIAIWVYYSQYQDSENSKRNAELQVQNNTLKYFSVSIKDILNLLNHQINNIDEFITEFKGDTLKFPLMEYVPLFPIKRIIDNTSLDKILISYIDRFSKNENAIKDFSELISILDYLYLELSSLPELLERGHKYDYERQLEFSNYHKKIWDIIGALIAHDLTGNNVLIAGYKKIVEDFISNDIDVRDIKLYYEKIILPVNEYSIQLLSSGKITTEFEQLAIFTRDAKQLYLNIIRHNEDFIKEDISLISKNIYDSFIKLQNQTKDLLVLIPDVDIENVDDNRSPIKEGNSVIRRNDYKINFMKIFRIRIEILVALLAFLGSLGGVYFSGILSKSQWEREKNYQVKQTILNKRMELIEKTLNAFNKGSCDFELLNNDYNLLQKLNDLKLAYTAKKGKPNDENIDFNIKQEDLYNRSLEDRKKMIEIVNDALITLSLDGMYFGPKTRKLIDSIHTNYHPILKTDSIVVVRLLDCMNSELGYALPDL